MKGLLKFITCGSVDDGKSTLIGHILYDSKLLYADQEEALELDSKVGSRGGKIDYSLLLDGLMAEREQGITIDVAYRYFTTDNRSFIVADTPGHEEYTRNMAVGASFADLAVILVDASQGVLIQTKRHARICSLMGIRSFVFAVNKMDLVGYDKKTFCTIEKEIKKLSGELGLGQVTVIPVSATEGDNVTRKSDNLPWYQGEALLPYLENVDIEEESEEKGFYMPVQRVCRPNHEFRGFQGQIEAGEIHTGDLVTALPSRETAHVRSIYVGDREESAARKGQPVTIQLDREVDISRGCVLSVDSGAEVSSSITAAVLWMDDEELFAGKNFFVKIGTKMVPGMVSIIHHSIDVNTGEKTKVQHLKKNEIALCTLLLYDRTVADEFKRHRTLGELILIDRITNMTSACGVITEIGSHSENGTGKKVDKEVRSACKSQVPVIAEFRLGRDGMTEKLVEDVEKALAACGRHTYLYIPEPLEDFSKTARHLNQAGILVLLVLNENAEPEETLAKEEFYLSGWQKDTGACADRIVKLLKEKTAFSSYIAVDRDYI